MNRCVVVFVNGYLEEKFYNVLLKSLPNEHLSIIVKNTRSLYGSINYKKNICRILTDFIMPFNKEDEIIAVLAHDSECYSQDEKSNIDWADVRSALKYSGATTVIEVIEKECFEDWILRDRDNLLKFLNLDNENFNDINETNGLKIIENMFRKANTIYIKGDETEGLIECLDKKIVITPICPQLRPLCKILNIECDGVNCKYL